jgi:hypothetical protein
MPAVLLIEFTSVEISSREILGASNWLDGRFLRRGARSYNFYFPGNTGQLAATVQCRGRLLKHQHHFINLFIRDL